jgi:hypothetical protein
MCLNICFSVCILFFIFGLLREIFSISGCIVLNGLMIWNETVVALFKVLSQHKPGATEEKHKNMSPDGWCLGRDFNPGPPRCEAGFANYLSRMFNL